MTRAEYDQARINAWNRRQAENVRYLLGHSVPSIDEMLTDELDEVRAS